MPAKLLLYKLLLPLPPPMMLLLPLMLPCHLISETDGLRSTKGWGASMASCCCSCSGNELAVVENCVQASVKPEKPLHLSAMSSSGVLLL